MKNVPIMQVKSVLLQRQNAPKLCGFRDRSDRPAVETYNVIYIIIYVIT